MPARQVALAECQTAIDVLRWAAGDHPDQEAYVESTTTGRRTLSFGGWDRQADGVAGLLSSRGVGRGDVVAILLGSGIWYAICYAAAQRLGAITAGLNPRLGPTEMRSAVGRCRPTVTVVDGGLPPALAAGAGGRTAAGAGGEAEASPVAPRDTPTIGSVVERAELEAAADGPAPRLPTVEPTDPVAVVWTSGTTGLPKGAVFTHENLEAVARGTDVLSQPGDRRLSPLPFAHVGYMTRVWDEVAHGVTTVVTPTPWQATDALRLLETERITVGQGVPTQWRLVLDLPELDRADLSALRIVGTGAARVPAELVAELRARLSVPVVVRYTSTESSLGTGTRPGDPDQVVATTVGRPVPGVELRIVNDEGRVAPAGEVGRVQLRSAAAMVGYWAARGPAQAGPVPASALVDVAATAPVRSPDGWITMGDFGRVDEEGNLRLAGRAHERYIRGGYNVYPSEVEEVLGSHPGVAEVSVVGTPDPVLGEVGVAFVVGATGTTVPTLEALRAHCWSQLADYKAPDALVVVAALPLTPMMKVDKQQLSAAAAEAAQERARQVAARTPARRGDRT